MTSPNGPFTPTPLPRWSFAGDVEGTRRYVSDLQATAVGLRTQARAVAGTGAALPGYWNSVPSSARAAGRLDALADLLRSQANRVDHAVAGLADYVGHMARARQAVLDVNVLIAQYNRVHRPGSVLPPPPSLGEVHAAQAALRAAGARCAEALTTMARGEGHGPVPVDVRIHDADLAAGETPVQLARTLRAAATARPPDLAVVEEGVRRLGRMSVSDPRGTAVVLDALGPLVTSLAGLGDGHATGDGPELAAIIAAAQAAARTVPHNPPPRAAVTRSSSATPTIPRTVAIPVGLPGSLTTVVRTAESFLGRPYVFAAAGPDAYGCSGLTMAAWRVAGVSLPHLASAQYDVGHRVPLAAARPGDLVFWADDTGRASSIHHVALYIGDGRIVEASTPGTVVHVRTLDPHEAGLMPFVVRPD